VRATPSRSGTVIKKQRWHFGLRTGTASRATTFLSPFYFLFLVLDVVLLIVSVIVSIILRIGIALHSS
jgi:hypothetical protein